MWSVGQCTAETKAVSQRTVHDSLHQRTHLKMMTLNSPGEKLVRRPRISAMALELVWAHARKVEEKTAGWLLEGCTFYSPRQRPRRTSHGNSAR